MHEFIKGLDVARPLALVLLAVAAVLPEYAVEVYFAWEGADPATSGRAPLTLAAVTGSGRLLVGLGWPLVILLVSARNGGNRLRLELEHRVALRFLLLSALYAFTISLNGFLSVLDTLFLLSLFAAYVWTVSRWRVSTTQIDGAVVDMTARVRRSIMASGLALALLSLSAVVVTMPFVDALVTGAWSNGHDQFGVVQWLFPLALKSPLLVVLGVLVWKVRPSRAAAALISSQIGLLTVLLGSIPLVYHLHGLILGDGVSLVLDDRQRSELFLAAAQSLFVVVLFGKVTVSPKNALLLLALFVIQALTALQPVGQMTLARPLLAAVYLGAALWLIHRDRTSLRALLQTVPVRERWPHHPFM